VQDVIALSLLYLFGGYGGSSGSGTHDVNTSNAGLFCSVVDSESSSAIYLVIFSICYNICLEGAGSSSSAGVGTSSSADANLQLVSIALFITRYCFTSRHTKLQLTALILLFVLNLQFVLIGGTMPMISQAWINAANEQCNPEVTPTGMF
jgi:hypothetical protein